MFEIFKNINKAISEVYKKRASYIFLDIEKTILMVIGGPILFLLYLVFLALLVFLGMPIIYALNLFEWLLIPIPYYIITGDSYYSVNEPLIVKYVDFIAKQTFKFAKQTFKLFDYE